jgi:hypothetical protein
MNRRVRGSEERNRATRFAGPDSMRRRRARPIYLIFKLIACSCSLTLAVISCSIICNFTAELRSAATDGVGQRRPVRVRACVLRTQGGKTLQFSEGFGSD